MSSYTMKVHPLRLVCFSSLAALLPSAVFATAMMDGMDMSGMHMGNMNAMQVAPATGPKKAPKKRLSSALKPRPQTVAPAPHNMNMDMPSMSMDHDMSRAPQADMTSGSDHYSHMSMPMDHGAMPGMTHDVHASPDMAGMDMASGPSPMASTSARSPDYSDGIAHGAMAGMDMDDTSPVGMLLVDQLEQSTGREGDGQRWGGQGWYGSDKQKLWVRSEGNRRGGRVQEGDIEALWYRPLSAFWGTQLGLRRDLNATGPQRTWAAMGVQGLAPYWFDVEATVYAGPEGRTAARLRSNYDLLITQRLVLQPELEANAYGRADPVNEIGAGLSDASMGLRLRYEVRREFAPYVGVVWNRRFGESAELAQKAGLPAADTQWVAGMRFWF